MGYNIYSGQLLFTNPLTIEQDNLLTRCQDNTDDYNYLYAAEVWDNKYLTIDDAWEGLYSEKLFKSLKQFLFELQKLGNNFQEHKDSYLLFRSEDDETDNIYDNGIIYMKNNQLHIITKGNKLYDDGIIYVVNKELHIDIKKDKLK